MVPYFFLLMGCRKLVHGKRSSTGQIQSKNPVVNFSPATRKS
jgi:hypothetical protein